ncbi:hypothetical protein ACWNXI_17865 [Caldibacillus thermoamylovorans]
MRSCPLVTRRETERVAAPPFGDGAKMAEDAAWCRPRVHEPERSPEQR